METDTDKNAIEKNYSIETDTFHPFRRWIAQWIDGFILPFILALVCTGISLYLAWLNITPANLQDTLSITIHVGIIGFLFFAIYDSALVCMVIFLFLAWLDITPAELQNTLSITMLVGIISLFVVALYEGVLLGCYGTTFGKLIMGIRMVDKDSGLPIGFFNGFKRYFFYLIFCFWGINFLAIFLPKYSHIISAITIIPTIAAWMYYKKHNITKWDNIFNIKVLYGPIHKFWLTLMILLMVLSTIFLAGAGYVVYVIMVFYAPFRGD